MTISRTFLVLPAALLALTLTSCGSEPSPVQSPEDARTAACRGYQLTVGERDTAAIKTLRDGAGFADPDSAKEDLGPLHDSAATSGLTPGLSEEDFTLFRKVVEEIDDLEDAIFVDEEGTGTLAPSTIDSLSDAFQAVRKRCY